MNRHSEFVQVATAVVEGASHVLFPEAPAAVAGEVVGYLRKPGVPPLLAFRIAW